MKDYSVAVTRTMAIEEKSANAVTNGAEAGASTSRPNDERYDAQSVEKKWFERWQQDASLYAAEPNSTKKKYYVLEMLPYPSGALHMGHVRNYSIGDALARYMWMNGYNVLHPMGWDSWRRVDAPQHRQHEGADEAPWVCLRLVARSYDMLS